MNNAPPGTPRPGPAEVSEALDRERRFDALGSALSTLRVFLVLVVQCYLLLGFSLIFVRPPSGAFYAALLALSVNTLLCAGCLVRGFGISREMLRLSKAGEAAASGNVVNQAGTYDGNGKQNETAPGTRSRRWRSRSCCWRNTRKPAPPRSW